MSFVIAHDPDRQFKFGTLQSEQARHILRDLKLSTTDYQTFLLPEKDHVSTKSTAALRVLRQLSWWWALYYTCVLVPVPIRDVVYDFVARHRYRWMARRRLVGSQLKKNVGDLSDYEAQQVRQVVIVWRTTKVSGL